MHASNVLRVRALTVYAFQVVFAALGDDHRKKKQKKMKTKETRNSARRSCAEDRRGIAEIGFEIDVFKFRTSMSFFLHSNTDHWCCDPCHLRVSMFNVHQT